MIETPLLLTQSGAYSEYIYANASAGSATGRLIAKRIQPITAGANNGTATVTYIHTDFLGSPVAESNSASTVTRIERYTPYSGPADMQLDVGPGFTGHATDVATGLTYMQQRYYDADIGRFISPDPVGPEEDFIKHFNRYNYALNNPVGYTDPDGRYSCAKDVCPKVRVIINGMRDARDKLPSNSKERKALNIALKTIGTENNGRGPEITSGDLRNGNAAQFDQKTKVIKIDFNNMDKKDNPSYEGGRSLVHETKHYSDDKKQGVALTVGGVRKREKSAVGAEKAFMKAHNQTMTAEEENAAIEGSVDNWLRK